MIFTKLVQYIGGIVPVDVMMFKKNLRSHFSTIILNVDMAINREKSPATRLKILQNLGVM